MAKELTFISPEGLKIAETYLQFGNIRAVCQQLSIPQDKVVETLNKREVKNYLDTVYLDLGYRNRSNLASLLDEIIESKLEEARESGMYSSKDLVDLIQLAHKMRIDELKHLNETSKVEAGGIKNQTNVQINNEGLPFGSGNYGKLMEKLMSSDEQ